MRPFLIAALLPLSILLTALGCSEQPPQHGEAEQYQKKLLRGMTLEETQQVVTTLPSPRAISFARYRWTFDDGSSITASFEEGKLVGYTASGLRGPERAQLIGQQIQVGYSSKNDLVAMLNTVPMKVLWEGERSRYAVTFADRSTLRLDFEDGVLADISPRS